MMTRDEALEIIKEHMDRHEVGDFYSVSPAYLLMMLQRLGMLKLDEPKSARNKFNEAIAPIGNVGLWSDNIWEVVHSSGLKIVEK